MVWGAGSAAEQLPSMCESGLSPQCFQREERKEEHNTRERTNLRRPK